MKNIVLKNISFNANNEPLSALTHFIGLVISIVALVAMVILAITEGTMMHIIGFSIFGVSLVLLYTSSFLYHLFPQYTRFKELFQRIDHVMIFLLIAGSYTPICLTLDDRKLGWELLIAIWAISIVGMLIKAMGIKIKVWKIIFLYALLGSILLIIINPAAELLPIEAAYWLFGGAMLYLIGTLFFIWEYYKPRRNMFDMHEIWHIFVMAASFSHVYLMIRFILYV